jgi:CheY-like chemotaxis protein
LHCKPSVLIVDRSEDSREVLCTALARRGVSTLEASHGEEALALVQQHQPNVVVVDLEFDATAEEEFCDRFTAQSQELPLVMLSRIHGPMAHSGRARGTEFLRKPYHYAPLLRRIEELLG